MGVTQQEAQRKSAIFLEVGISEDHLGLKSQQCFSQVREAQTIVLFNGFSLGVRK